MSTDLLHIMEENSSKIAVRYGEDTFPDLFWKQQLQAARLKNGKNMRWHPFMIRLDA